MSMGLSVSRVLYPGTAPSENEGIQTLNSIFPTLERDVLSEVTFLQTEICDHYARSNTNMKNSYRGGRCKEQFE